MGDHPSLCQSFGLTASGVLASLLSGSELPTLAMLKLHGNVFVRTVGLFSSLLSFFCCVSSVCDFRFIILSYKVFEGGNETKKHQDAVQSRLVQIKSTLSCCCEEIWVKSSIKRQIQPKPAAFPPTRLISELQTDFRQHLCNHSV